MGILQILLVAILITLLGAWSIVGGGLLIIVAILVTIGALFGVAKLLPALADWFMDIEMWKDFGKEIWESLRISLIVMILVAIVLWILSSGSL